MPERKPVRESGKSLQSMSRWSSDAEWTTAELRDALRQGGVDPDHLVRQVMSEIQPLLQASDTAPETNRDVPRPLLVALREHTQLAPSAIAEAMDVPVTFLSVLSRYPTAVPAPWRQELANRAQRQLDMEPHVVLDAFAAPLPYELAASRDTPYAPDAVRGYEDLLERSGLSPEAKPFWQALAADASP
ncbi:MAG: hypothetical protein OEU26_37610 [Candidatus Tectomicrobia bacterium]|nr:hypothetical protein [Candidatus Tectomicrobia bacterium]